MFKHLPRLLAIVLIAVSADASAQAPADPPRERLGVRASVTGTMSDLNENFGNGYDFTLYFTERIWRGLNLDVRIGATYLGDLIPDSIATEFTKSLDVILAEDQRVSSEMRLAYLTLGPQYVWRLNNTQNLYGSLGLGIYSVSMLFDTGIQAFDLSDQHFGGSAGGGFLWRITDNWNIDVNATAHGIWTGDDTTTLYYRFSGKGRNPVIYNIGLGLAMDLR
jgi:opacity protein-like surface antigen